MQAEFPRGNGFIISPDSRIPEKVFPTSPPLQTDKIKKVSVIKEAAIDAIYTGTKAISYTGKQIFFRVLSASVAVCCVIGFFSFFTVSTAIFHNGRVIAYSHNEKGYYGALASAKSYAEEKGVSSVNTNFETAIVFTLKNKLSSGKALRNKLLLSFPGFSQACTLYSDNTAIFNAPNEKIAREVVSEHISSLSMNGDASPESVLTYKENILPEGQISNKDECSFLLSQSGSVPVISVVNMSEQKEIPFDTKTVNDDSLHIGEAVTVSEGKPGSAEVKSEKIYKNGTQESSRILSENVIINPVSRVVRVGTKPKDVLQSGLLYPLKGRVSSRFGKRWGRNHEGIDFAVPVGTPVKSAECGIVTYAGNGGSYGNLVKIDHGNGVVTAYAHLSEISVKEGQSVSPETQIALSGNTGRSTGPHLHFEVIKDDVPLNPDSYLKER